MAPIGDYHDGFCCGCYIHYCSCGHVDPPKVQGELNGYRIMGWAECSEEESTGRICQSCTSLHQSTIDLILQAADQHLDQSGIEITTRLLKQSLRHISDKIYVKWTRNYEKYRWVHPISGISEPDEEEDNPYDCTWMSKLYRHPDLIQIFHEGVVGGAVLELYLYKKRSPRSLRQLSAYKVGQSISIEHSTKPDFESQEVPWYEYDYHFRNLIDKQEIPQELNQLVMEGALLYQGGSYIIK